MAPLSYSLFICYGYVGICNKYTRSHTYLKRDLMTLYYETRRRASTIQSFFGGHKVSFVLSTSSLIIRTLFLNEMQAIQANIPQMSEQEIRDLITTPGEFEWRYALWLRIIFLLQIY